MENLSSNSLVATTPAKQVILRLGKDENYCGMNKSVLKFIVKIYKFVAFFSQSLWWMLKRGCLEDC